MNATTSAPTLQMLHLTTTGSATVVDVPVNGPQRVQQLVGGRIEGFGVCADLAFYAARGAVLDQAPNPFIFDIVGAFGAPARMVFGDVVIFAGADAFGNERSLSDSLAAVLIDLVRGVTERPESICEITALCNDLREMALIAA